MGIFSTKSFHNVKLSIFSRSPYVIPDLPEIQDILKEPKPKVLDKLPSYMRKIRGIPTDILVKKYHISEKSDFDFNYGYLLKDSKKHIREDMNYPPGYYAINITIFKNAYVTRSYSISDGKNLYAHSYRRNIDWNYFGGEGSKVVAQVDEIIAFGHLNCYIYGHWFLDTLTALMFLPEEILHRAKVISANVNFTYETYELLGIKRDQVVEINDNEAVFSRIVYGTSLSLHVWVFGTPTKLLKERLKRGAGVSNSPPKGFYIMNRFTKHGGESRRISEKSFNETLNYVKTKYPSYPWKPYYDDIRIVKKAVIFWHNVKFMFAPTGSNIMGILFMQKNTVITNFIADVKDFAFYNIAIVNQVWFIAFCNPNTRHFGSNNRPSDLNMDYAHRVIDAGMDIIISGKLPNDDFQLYCYK